MSKFLFDIKHFSHTKDPVEIGIFFAALFARFGALLFLVFWYAAYPIAGSDSHSYISAARGFLETGHFINEVGMPNSYEMPLYPMFVALLSSIGGLLFVAVVQCILGAITALCIFRIGCRISRRVGIISALCFAFEPAGVLYTGFILTEPLFIFLLVGAAFLLVTRPATYPNIFASGFVLGLATLVRPVGEVLIPAFLLFYALRSSFHWKAFASIVAVFIVGFGIVVGPWMVRNMLLFGRSELSAVASLQFAYAHAPLLYAYENNIPEKEAIMLFHKRILEVSPYDEDILANRAGTLYNAPYLWQVAFEYLGEHPIAFARFHIIKTIPFFFSDGIREISSRIGLIDGKLPNISNLILRGDLSGIWHAFAPNITWTAIVLSFSLYWAFVAFGCVASLFFVFRAQKEVRALIFVCLTIVAIHAAVAGGAVSHPRYRASIAPFMLIAATYGWLNVVHRISRSHV